MNPVTALGLKAILHDGPGIDAEIQHYKSWSDLRHVSSPERPDLLILDGDGMDTAEVLAILDVYKRKPLRHGSIVLGRNWRSENARLVVSYRNTSALFSDDGLRISLHLAVVALQNGHVHIDRKVIDLLDQPQPMGLSQVQKQILELMALDLNAEEIASVLGGSATRTQVYKIQERLRKRLGVKSNKMLLETARRMGLLGE